MDDTTRLAELNEQFIDAFRLGSWARLEPVLAGSFAYLDGVTGERWTNERYVENLEGHPSPALEIDQVEIHVTGDTACVSARTRRGHGRYGRYVDTYSRIDGEWLCVHACVWSLAAD